MAFKFISKRFILPIIGIFLISSLPYLFFNMKEEIVIYKLIKSGSLGSAGFLKSDLSLYPIPYFVNLFHNFVSLLHLKSMTFFDGHQAVKLFPYLNQLYLLAMKFLFSALFLGLLIGMVISFIIMTLPVPMRRMINHIIFFFESLPDIFVVLLLQFLVIAVYQRFGIKISTITSTYGHTAYLLPTLTLSFLPTIYIIKYLVLSLADEEKEQYVEFARSKGIPRFKLLTVHILRNALPSFINHFKTIYWYTLSNLLMLEILFNINGFMTFLFQVGTYNPQIVPVCLLMIFIPFTLFVLVGEFLLKITT